MASTANPLITVTVAGFISKINKPGPPSQNVVSDLVTASPSGGSGAYLYQWSELSQGSGNGITIKQPTKQSTVFVSALKAGNAVSGGFVCTVTDKGDTTKKAASGVVHVYLELLSKNSPTDYPVGTSFPIK